MKTSFARRALLALTSVLACLGCDGEAADPAPRPPIEGDWFTCIEAHDCTDLRAGGLRFAADCMVYHLQAAERTPPLFLEGDPYCVTEPFADYEHEGDLLTLTLHHDELVTSSSFAIDEGGSTANGGVMLKVTASATGVWVDNRCVAEDN